MRMFYVNDGVPEITTHCIRSACEQRSIPFEDIEASMFDFAADRRARPGDLLYRPAISLAAIRAEQFLYVPGVATFYSDDDGVYFQSGAGPILYEAAGLPVPRTVSLACADRDLLDAHVETMGGYPVIVKVLGSSGGIGVMRLDSAEALYSVVDHLIAQRASPLLCAYVDNAVHWRLIVIGDRVAAAYRNVGIDRDFRSAVSSAAEDYGLEPPAEMAAVATRAVALLHLEFGGVDLLEHPTGRIYLLEVNFPCFFAQPQMTIGTDLGGMMVDHLIAKSRRLARG